VLLTGELVTGQRLAASEAILAPGEVTGFAAFRRAVNGVGGAAKIQQRIWVATDLLCCHPTGFDKIPLGVKNPSILAEIRCYPNPLLSLVKVAPLVKRSLLSE